MLGKTDVYPYHRKGLEAEKEKRGLENILELSLLKEKFRDLTIGSNAILLAGIGLLLARAQVLGELMPFGVAFLGAVAAVKGNLVPVLIATVVGLITATSGMPLYLNLGVFLVLAIIFLFYSQAVKSHWLMLPAIIFASNFVVKAVGYAFFEPGIYFWVIALVESLLAAGLAVLFFYTFTNVTGKGFAWDKLVPEEMACILVLCLGLVIGLADITFWEMSIRAIVSKLVILAGALLYGPGAGAIIGSIVGVIPGGNSVMTPAFAGILAFSGVLAGVFRQFQKIGVFTGFVLGNLIFTVYLADQITVMYYLGETMLAGLVLLILPIGAVQALPAKLATGISSYRGERVKGNSGTLVKRKIKELSQIFREIARTFEETAPEGKWHSGKELILENVKSKLCQECSGYQKCWTGNSKETAKVIEELVIQLGRQDRVMSQDLPGSFLKKCKQSKEFALAVACSYDTWQVSDYWQRKSMEQGKLVPQQLKGVSEIMDNLLEKVEQGDQDPKNLENKLFKMIKAKGIQIKKLSINKNQHEGIEMLITQSNCGGRIDCSEAVAAAGTELIGKNIKIEKLQCDFQSTKGNCSYRLKPALQFKVAVGKAQATKAGSPVSGDSYSLMPLSEGKFALLLSDGMGSGQKAKLESNTTVALLEHLLESGFDKETAVRTINSILILRSKEECFATLDMAVIDLYSGKLEHTKIGAAPSFLKRGSRVGILKASSLPIGILNKVESVTIVEQLQVGDIIVLASDGVLEAEQNLLEKESWVQELLSKLSTDDPQEIADQILFQARVLSADKTKDDMTVLVGRIDSRLH